jgi:hypothetical protein
MNTTNPTIPVDTITPSGPSRVRRRTIGIGVAIGAAAAIAIATSALVATSDETPVRPDARTAESDYGALRDLVDRGLIPRESLYPAPMTDDELRDLVERGVVPRQALEPAPS